MALAASRSIPRFLIVAATAAVVFAASPALGATFTATAVAGSAVTMDDPTGSITFTVTNTTAGPARFIDRVRFYFTRTQYFIARGTTAPTNWTVGAISNPAAGAESYVEFRANNAAARIAPGASLSFTVMLQGMSYANLPRSAADVTDFNTRVRSRDNTGLWTNQTGAAPSWARRSLAVTLIATPDAVGVGQAITLTMQVENRSTASKASITASPNPPTANLGGGAAVTQTGGPTYSPSPLTLNAGVQGTITYTYRADAAGTVSWSAGATAASATSKTGTSNTVVINPLAVSLSVDPLSVISGQNVTVTMLVQNPYIGGIGASDTTIPVGSTSGFPGSGVIRIDSEQMSYTGTTATSFTGLTRGINGTTAVAHSSGSSVWGTSTTLSSGIAVGDTTIPVATTSGFLTSGTLLIDNEQMSYTGTTATSFTGVTRGINGTAAAAHSNGTRIWGIVGSVLVTSVTTPVSTTTLSAGISATDTTIPAASTSMFPSVGVLRVDNELIRYSGKTAATFTGVTRGANGTTASAHSSGSIIELWGISFGNLVPTLTSSGTATATLVSGPTPASLASLPPGQTGVFQWVYTITGTVPQTYQFQGSVTADGTYTSNTAQSQQGTIGALVVTTSPSAVASATAPLPLSFTLSNRTGAALRSVCMYQPNATFTVAYTSASSACGSWTVAPFGGARPGVRFTANNNPSRVANGGSCVFTVNYASAPTVTKDTDYVFQFDGLTGGNCSAGYRGTAYGRLTVTEYAVALTHAPATAPADGTSQVTLTATLTRAGSPLANRTIAFTTTAGKLSSGTAVTNASGQAQVILTAPSSSTAVTAPLTATYVKAVGRDSVNFSAFSGPNLQYIGGTLSPMAVPKGSGCPNLTFALQVRNVGTANTTLNSNSFFTFTDGTNTFTAYLNSSTNVNTVVPALLSFGSPTSAGGGGGVALNPSFVNGSYAPSLNFYGTGIASPPQVRPVSDNVTVAGTCAAGGSGGSIRILDWREIVR